MQAKIQLEATVNEKAEAYLNGGALTIPHSLRTLQDALELRSKSETTISYINKLGEVQTESYAQMVARVRALGNALSNIYRNRNSTRIMIHFGDPCEVITAFWACVHAGLTVIPMGPLDTYGRGHAGSEAFMNIWEFLDRPLILSSSEGQDKLADLALEFQVDKMETISSEELEEKVTESKTKNNVSSSLTALILFTSGSTGIPKGVPLSHENIIASTFGLAALNDFSDKDINLNWLSVNHAAGLIVHHISKFIIGCEQIQVAGAYILEDPLRWLDLLESFNVTGTWAPNFAFSQVNKRLTGNAKIWNLRHVRLIGAGAEPTNVATVNQFLRNLQPFGLPPEIMCNGWGMSETAGCVTKPDCFIVDGNQATTTVAAGSMRYGEPVEFCEMGPGAVTFSDVGAPIPGLEMRITDQDSKVVAEGVLGSLQVRGSCVITQYLATDITNQKLFVDGWLLTGDLGFIYDGKLVLTGREKDIIIINGVNHSNSEIEQVVERLGEVRPSFTVACALREKNADTDVLAVIYSPQTSDSRLIIEQKNSIRRAVLEEMGLVPNHLYAVRTLDVTKTPIGKLQRSRMAALLQDWIGHHACLSRIEWHHKLKGVEKEKAILSAKFDAVIVLNTSSRSPEILASYKTLYTASELLENSLEHDADPRARRIALVIPDTADGVKVLSAQLSLLKRWLERQSNFVEHTELIVLVDRIVGAPHGHCGDYLASPVLWSMVSNWALMFNNIDTWVRSVLSTAEPESFANDGLGNKEAYLAAQVAQGWLVPTLVPSAPDSALYPHSLQPRAKGRYLVVGGSGGIGKKLVEYLISAGAEEITIVGRHAVKHLAMLERVLREKVTIGTELPALRAIDQDLSNHGSHKALLKTLGGSASSLTGIVFCAGAWDSLLQESTVVAFSALNSALGLIDESTKLLMALDAPWALIIGAVSGCLRSIGGAYYSAVNVALESAAAMLRANNRNVILAQSTSWDEIGLSGRVSMQSGSLFDRLNPEAAISVLDEALRTGLSNFIIGRPKATEFAAARVSGLIFANVDPTYVRQHRIVTQHIRNANEVKIISATGSITNIQRLVGEAIGHALNLTEVSTEDDFFALGGSSLQIAVVNATLRKSGYWIRPGKFFQERYVGSIATQVESLSNQSQANVADPNTPLRIGHVESDNVQIHFEYYGQGGRPVIIFFNGIVMSTPSWRPYLPYFLENFDILLWDMRGQGQSTSDDAPYSYYDSARALEKILLHLKITSPVNLLSISLGSYVALEFVRQFPKLVRRVVISGASFSIARENFMRETDEELEMLDASLEAWASHLLPRLMSKRFIQPDFLAGRIEALITAYQHRKFSVRRLICSHADYLEDLPTLIPDLRKLLHPVLVIAGADDCIAPSSQQRQLSNILPNLRYVEYPDTGHLPHVEKSEFFFQDALAHFSDMAQENSEFNL